MEDRSSAGYDNHPPSLAGPGERQSGLLPTYFAIPVLRAFLVWLVGHGELGSDDPPEAHLRGAHVNFAEHRLEKLSAAAAVSLALLTLLLYRQALRYVSYVSDWAGLPGGEKEGERKKNHPRRRRSLVVRSRCQSPLSRPPPFPPAAPVSQPPSSPVTTHSHRSDLLRRSHFAHLIGQTIRHLTSSSLAILLVLYCLRTTAAVTNDRSIRSTLDRRVEAYDCSAPQTIDDRALNDQFDTCSNRATTVRHRNMTAHILYKEPVQRIKAHKCSVRDDRRVSYCGTYDHQTNFHRYAYNNFARPPTPTACRTMIREGHYTAPDGKKIDVELNNMVQYAWEEVGHTFTGSDTLAPELQVKCRGGDWRQDGELFKNMVVDHTYQVLLEEVTLLKDGTYLRDDDGNILHCSPFSEDCQTSSATYVWPSTADYCPLGISKTVTGLVVTDESGSEVFMSSDGNMVRLVLDTTVGLCNERVISTNYERFYLVEKGHPGKFKTSIDPRNVDFKSYVNNRDDFIYNHIISAINKELSTVLLADCERRHREVRRDYYLSHKNPGMLTYTFGNGTFATSAGEVLYYYQCKKEIVEIAEMPYCYDALPIFLPMDSPLRRTFNATQWYMEPLTRRLTRYASVVPCVRNFAPKYRLLSGRWAQVDPVFHMAEDPGLMTSPDSVLIGQLQHMDLSHGGVFSDDDMKAWEASSMLPRIRDAIGSSLSRQVTNDYTRGTADPLVTTPEEWFQGKVTGVLASLEGYGEFCATMIGCYFIYRCIVVLVEWFYNGCQIYKEIGRITPRLLWVLCPTFFLMRDRRRHRPPSPKDEPHRRGYDSDNSDEYGIDRRPIVNPSGNYAAHHRPSPPSDHGSIRPRTHSNQFGPADNTSRHSVMATNSPPNTGSQPPPPEPHVKQPGASRLSRNNSGHRLSRPPSLPTINQSSGDTSTAGSVYGTLPSDDPTAYNLSAAAGALTQFATGNPAAAAAVQGAAQAAAGAFRPIPTPRE